MNHDPKIGAVQKVRVTDLLDSPSFFQFKKDTKIILSSKMKLRHNITERTIFYEQSNDYSWKGSHTASRWKRRKTPAKRNVAPTFKPYDNRQVQMIYDIESLVPEHHVARVVDEMVEAIPDKPLFFH
ncbi:hypothetical protein GFC29_801 [Anoxybacillus sp. B7M1]|uniref:hypothetical protein n=1 Tax=unclassified Anoxybacillus TaxID=2639704 RepID=UPI0005CD1476|nr:MULTISPECIES: hypothetical protein [unclassified Anoxybacillus]ANB58068.1 hypothetical protein GFC28_825 [Anoxybacillus sp. B2M1]ANB64617.1 hypothetical protein GFC29_801 [Anoxybacillus sp. B7M1]